MIRIADAREQVIHLRSPARRIISLVPSQTELLASLGLDREVVGVTRFCVRPDHWKSSRKIVGGTKTLNVDRIRSLQPDLILANREENTQPDVDALEQIAPVYVSDVKNLDDAFTMIEDVARLTGREPDGRTLCDGIRSAFLGLGEHEPVRAAYLIWDDPLMTVGHDTFIHDVMQRGGFLNVFGERTRYPSITWAELARAEPDVLLLPDEPYPFDEGHAERFGDRLPRTRVFNVDGQIFSWYGSRLIHTPGSLRALRARLRKA